MSAQPTPLWTPPDPATTPVVRITVPDHVFTAAEIQQMAWKTGAAATDLTAEAIYRAIRESDGDLMVPFTRRITATLHVEVPNPHFNGHDVLPGMEAPAPTIRTCCEVEL